MNRQSGQGRSQRQHRVGELLRHAISDVLMRGDLRDPALEGVSITVTEVRVSADLKNATAYVMPLGGDAAGEVEEALNRCAEDGGFGTAHERPWRRNPALPFRMA